MFEAVKYFWALRKQHYKKNVLIIGAGPSVGLADVSSIRALQDRGWCIVTLKQASLFYSNFDIAIANDVRETRIEKQRRDQNLIGVSRPKLDLDWDIKVPILAYWWSLTMLRRPLMFLWNPLWNPFRPWGVGVFFEMAIFLPYIFKSRQIATIGFDMAITDGKGFDHFYGTKHNEVFDQGVSREISLISGCTRKIKKIFKDKNCEIRSLTVEESPISFKKYTDSKKFFADLISVS